MKNTADDINIEVMDDDFGKDEKLGESAVKLSAFCIDNGIDNWFDVQLKGKVVGQVHFRSVWLPA